MHPIAARLYATHDFEDEIVDCVVRAAEHQEVGYAEFVKRYDVGKPVRYKPKGLPAIQVLDIKPKGSYDPAQATILHLPMANGLTRNKIFRATVLHMADPTRRLIVFANPGVVIRDHYGKPRTRHLRRIARGDLTPIVASSLAYVAAQGISSVIQCGYSFGADRALAMTAEAAAADIKVTKLIVADPASLTPQSLGSLAKSFRASGRGLQQTLQQADSLTLRQSRTHLSEHPFWVTSALLRPTNIAIALALAKGGFESRLAKAMQAQPGMAVHIIWGSESELAQDELMEALVVRYEQLHPGRLSHSRIIGKNHSMADDVAVHAAIMLPGYA